MEIEQLVTPAQEIGSKELRLPQAKDKWTTQVYNCSIGKSLSLIN